MAVDFEKELVHITGTIKPPEVEIYPEVIEIGAESLDNIDHKYGPESDHPLLYHNAPHSLDVCRRVVRLLNIFYPYIRPKYRIDIYNLAILDGATHDWQQDLTEPGANERASAEYLLGKVSDKGPAPLDTEAVHKRLTDGVMATAVERKEDGELVQANLQSGSNDPLKFGMGFADINGIAMEGSKRMLRDATHLCYEIFGDPSIDQLYTFLISQAGFLRQRLNDGRVKSDIAYYFPDDIDAVYGGMRKAFHSNIVSAFSLAVVLGEHPELKNSLRFATHSLDVLDRTLPGDIISRTLLKKLAGIPKAR